MVLKNAPVVTHGRKLLGLESWQSDSHPSNPLSVVWIPVGQTLS